MTESQPYGPGSHAPFDDVHEMPACHPIKGNADSMKYHRPDSQGYPNTKAEVWFVSPSVAEAAGFVLAGSHPDGSSSADYEPGASGHPCTAAQLDEIGLGALGLGGAAAATAASGFAGSHDETTKMPVADLDDDVTVSAAAGENVRETVKMSAANEAADMPFGLGSHAPFDDVHEMPACHPIKGNAGSMKYHRPDSQGYEKTKAEVWFVSPSVAEAAGFALAGSHPDGSSSADFEPGTSAHPCTAAQLESMGLRGLGLSSGGGSSTDADETSRVGVAAAGVGAAAAVTGAAAILGDDDTEVAAEAAAAKAAEKAEADAAAEAAAEKAEADDGVGVKGLAAAGAGVAGVAAAAALLGGDDDETKDLASIDDDVTQTAADTRETIDTKPAAERDTIRSERTVERETIRDTIDETEPAKGKGRGKAVAAAGVAGAAGVAATKRGASATKDVAAGTTSRVAAGRGGRGGDDDRGVAAAAGGSWGWLKWALPLLLLLILLGLLLALCGGGSDDEEISAVADDPTAVPATATAEPEPTATPEPEPTATPEPEPTAAPEPAASCASLVTTLQDNSFNILVSAAASADVAGALSDSGALTLFAPTDAAFEAVPEDIAAAILADTDLLTSLLQYHVVPGAILSGDLDPASVETLNGSSLAVRTDLGGPTVNASGITIADLSADECVVHGVDSVLIPPSLLSTLGVQTLNAAVGGSTIVFEDGTADFTSADSATMTAICNLIATEDSTNELPPLQWQASGDAALDAARAAAIDDALASCGPGSVATEQLAPIPSFTG